MTLPRPWLMPPGMVSLPFSQRAREVGVRAWYSARRASLERTMFVSRGASLLTPPICSASKAATGQLLPQTRGNKARDPRPSEAIDNNCTGQPIPNMPNFGQHPPPFSRR
jgi:hypothetical protein